MHENKGHYIPISASRRIIMDLMHEARQVPSIPVQRVIELKDLVSIRRNTQPRISWFVIFMKAFSLVAKDYPQLRRSLISCPWIRFYDHPYSNCSLAIEREHMGERCLFFSQFRGPESQSLVDLQKALDRYKSAPVESMGMYRRVLHIGMLPRFIRKFLWWSSLNVSGSKRAKRMGTFGVTSYGSLGAESLHPISPLSFTLNFGPISKEGTVALKIIYDHRILDGSEVARRLKDIEEALHGAIRAELKLLTQIPDFATDTDTESLDKQSQIRQDEAHEKPEPKLEMDPTPARVNRTPANS
jgi:pyruvate/2-oxoglutarate dehydrogenase complex dihydrolipoamide acyltransferase (E2) component